MVSSDARSLTDIDALSAQVKSEFDTFDLLFVNAGFSIPKPLASVTEAIYDEVFNLNAKGGFAAGCMDLSVVSRIYDECAIGIRGSPTARHDEGSPGCREPAFDRGSVAGGLDLGDIHRLHPKRRWVFASP